MAVLVPAATAARLAKVRGLLGADQDGEALTAARLADRLVRKRLGVPWGEVLPPPAPAGPPAAPPAWREPTTWRQAAHLALQWPACLTAWEQASLASVLRFPFRSAKQRTVLDRLVHKARATAGAPVPAAPAAWHPPVPADADPPDAP
jgi:hypothetical protein